MNHHGVSLIIEKVSIILCQDIPAEIQIPVIVSVISPGKAIKLEEVAAASSDHKPLLNKKMDRILQNTGKALDPSDLKRDYTALCKVINTTGTALTEIKVPLAGLAVEKGKPFDLQVSGYVQGSVLRNPSSLQFYVVQQPISGAFCKQFAIYDKNSNIVYVSQTNPPETTNVTLPVSSSDNFYYVYFVFFHDPYGNITSDVITSPIFVDR